MYRTESSLQALREFLVSVQNPQVTAEVRLLDSSFLIHLPYALSRLQTPKPDFLAAVLKHTSESLGGLVNI